jgi:hypothetical protein
MWLASRMLASLHMDPRTGKRVTNLERRLRAAVQRVDRLRDDATRLGADLRNRLHMLLLQRRAVERLEDNRQGPTEAGGGGDERQDRAG